MHTKNDPEILQRVDDYHIPVLKNEVLEYLDPQPGKTYLDVTFGGGGHTRAILEAEPTCRVIGFDWDMVAIERGQKMVEEFQGRLQLIWGNFSHFYRLVKKNNITKIDGILADFGTSHHQILSAPGFSLYKDTPLDMRMSPSHYRITAAIVLNTYSEKELRNIFSRYGEERYSGRLARMIVEHRKQRRFKTTKQLASFIEQAVPYVKGRGVHPATQVFQALRIFVNHELDNIEEFLKQAIGLVEPGARLVCISFHSLEDRIVKYFFKEHTHMLEILTSKVVRATPEEIAENASSRSARLRAAKKL